MILTKYSFIKLSSSTKLSLVWHKAKSMETQEESNLLVMLYYPSLVTITPHEFKIMDVTVAISVKLDLLIHTIFLT